MRRLTFGMPLTVAATVACTGDANLDHEYAEPLVVHDASFHDGELESAESAEEFRVTAVESPSGLAVERGIDRSLPGRVHESAYAVAVRFTGLGSGFWVVPVADLSPLFPGEREFEFNYDISYGVPPGIHTLEIRGVDREGRGGAPFALDLCVLDDDRPDDINPCDPSVEPPDTVIALTWDRNVDLDLSTEDPNDALIGWKRPQSPAATEDMNGARLSRDSNAACVIDGRNSESIVWPTTPFSGTYSVYVDLFDACGQPSVLFSVVLYRKVTHDDGTFGLEEDARSQGSLIDLQASGGAGPALFITEFDLP